MWLIELIRAATPQLEKQGDAYPALKDVQDQYPWKQSRGFERLLRSMAWNKVREIGLLSV
jgi:hypothetical protein